MKIDLDEWEKAEKDPLLQKTLPVCHDRILALIERVRELEGPTLQTAEAFGYLTGPELHKTINRIAKLEEVLTLCATTLDDFFNDGECNFSVYTHDDDYAVDVSYARDKALQALKEDE